MHAFVQFMIYECAVWLGMSLVLPCIVSLVYLLTYMYTYYYIHTVLPYFNEYLPTEVLVHIFSFLRERDLCHIGQVCVRFRQISNLDSLWKNLFRRIFEMPEAYSLPKELSDQPTNTSIDESMDTSECEEGNLWKSQFQIMVGCGCDSLGWNFFYSHKQ